MVFTPNTVASQVSKYMANAVTISNIWGDIITNVKASPYLAKGDGVTDDTAAIQAAINAGSNIIIPSGTYMINAVTKISVPSNKTIVFQQGAVFQVITNSSDSYRALSIDSATNVMIINPTIIGDRTTHTGTTGEQGHGIFVGTCDNVKISNPFISNCWGDGIYILNRSGRVVIDNPLCNNNRRQGISIICADDLTINNPYCSNTNGTAPEGGIDIEPSFAEDIFNNVIINNPKTYNNAGAGITLSLAMMAATNKEVNITITNHDDQLSAIGFSCFNNQAGVTGKITNLNPIYRNSYQNGIYIRSCEAVGTPLIEIDNPTVINPNESNSAASTAQNGILIHRPVGDAGSNAIGNVVIRNPRVIDNRTTSQTVRGIYMRDEKDITTQKIYVVDPIEITGVLTNVNKVVFNPGGVIFRDRFKSYIFDNSGSATVASPYTEVINNGAVAKTIFTLNFVLIHDALIKFVNVKTTGLQIKPEATAKLFPISSVAGKYIETVQIGASLTLRKINATDYYIDSMTGTWTVEP